MASMNRVFLMGNLTRDPELRHTPGGTAVADLGVAVNETFTNKDGKRVESKCFADVVAWGKQAEACAQYLAKGAPVLVEGGLQFDQWETDKGEKRSRLRVRASRVQFVGRARNGQNGDATGQADPQPSQTTDDAEEESEGHSPF
jgi:single-strand DNA-binding protein